MITAAQQKKEAVLVEALPYIQNYEGKTFVIKYGGAAQSDPELRKTFAKDVTLLRKIGINIIVVHGGGKEITRLAQTLGIETKFINGQRYTDEATMRAVTMVLAGGINKEIVNLINTNGGNAVGLCGADHTLLKVKKHQPNGADLGLVGEVTAINTSFIDLLIKNEIMPVIAPIGVGEDRQLHNVNADLAAAAVARAMKAEKLVYLSDVEGIMIQHSLVSTMTKAKAKQLIADGSIFGGMIPKVESALETLDAGVHKVHIIDGREQHSLLLEIFTDEGIGTQFVHENNGSGRPG
ncbi:MAG: acetylglutamate kinase [Ignavibacteria bacterium]|nr:acetylglutamate kinase [Ignavibacteria bacterium]